ncbi:hypothetical protein LCGC14_3162230 [marine sediment metagenome]|uniref:HNH nuclease domain-containing protein n=1 Tax=marine sediment metagenome TaxID=412755 RepID=A0A0F8XXL4_9ZZZZ
MNTLVEKDGRKRKNVVLVKCAHCRVKVLSRKDQLRKYCSKQCSAKGRRNRIEIPCGYCGKKIRKTKRRLSKSKSGLVFCSREHKDWAQRIDSGVKEVQPSHYGDGKSSYRKRALQEYGSKCVGCNYCELEDMLDVHHIDKDRENNSLTNLVVLCVFCHALITRGLVKITDERKLIREGPW